MSSNSFGRQSAEGWRPLSSSLLSCVRCPTILLSLIIHLDGNFSPVAWSHAFTQIAGDLSSPSVHTLGLHQCVCLLIYGSNNKIIQIITNNLIYLKWYLSCSFGCTCPSFKISVSEISASALMQCWWMGFCLWCLQHRQSVFFFSLKTAACCESGPKQRSCSWNSR